MQSCPETKPCLASLASCHTHLKASRGRCHAVQMHGRVTNNPVVAQDCSALSRPSFSRESLPSTAAGARQAIVKAAPGSTFRVEKAAACASRAWLRFCSTEYSCMNPFTSCGLHNRQMLQQAGLMSCRTISCHFCVRSCEGRAVCAALCSL